VTDSRVRTADLTDASFPWRHDSLKLAETLIGILDEFTGTIN